MTDAALTPSATKSACSVFWAKCGPTDDTPSTPPVARQTPVCATWVKTCSSREGCGHLSWRGRVCWSTLYRRVPHSFRRKGWGTHEGAS